MAVLSEDKERRHKKSFHYLWKDTLNSIIARIESVIHLLCRMILDKN